MYCSIEDFAHIKPMQGVTEEDLLIYIARAQKIIDAYLRGRTAIIIPIPDGDPVPDEIRDIAIKTTVCQYVREMKSLHGASETLLYGLEQYCKESQEMIKDLADGTATLEADGTVDVVYSGIFYTGRKDIETTEL